MRTLFLLLLLSPLFLFGEIHWSSPQSLPYAKGEATHPAIAMNQHGDGIIIWMNQSTGTLHSALYNPHTDQLSSSVEIALGKGIRSPKVVLDAQKNATLLWIDEGQHAILTCQFDPLLKEWTQPIPLLTSKYSIESLQLMINAEGNLFAIWRQSNGVNTLIQAATFRQSVWKGPVDISLVGFDCDEPQICPDEHGNAIAVWSTSNPLDEQMIIQVSKFDHKTQKWSYPITLSGGWSNHAYLTPRITSDLSGNFYAVWTQREGHRSNIQTTTFLSQLKKWTLPSALTRDGASHTPILTRCGETLFAIWQTTGKKGSTVYYSTYRSAHQWSQEESLFNFDGKVETMQVVPDTCGKANMIWSNAKKIYASQYETPSWQRAVVVSDQKNVHDLQIVGDQYGNGFALWEKDHEIFYVAGNFLLPPKEFDATRREKRYPAKTVTYIDLRWTPSKSPKLKGYQIYRDGALIGFAHPEQSRFLDYRCPARSVSYKITAINHTNLESRPSEITVP